MATNREQKPTPPYDINVPFIIAVLYIFKVNFSLFIFSPAAKASCFPWPTLKKVWSQAVSVRYLECPNVSLLLARSQKRQS